MSGYIGRLMLLEIGTGSGAIGSETFTAIAALTTNNLTINNQIVDVTTKSDAGNRTLLDAKVLQSLSVSGSFVLRDEATHKTLQTAATAGLLRNFRINVPGDSTAGGTYAAPFAITQLSFDSPSAEATTGTITLESSGAVTYTAAT